MLTHSPRIITNGLVLCLDAANRKSYPGSGNSWRDLSLRGANGTLINGPTFNSSNGGSIVFDGTNDYGTFSTPSTITTTTPQTWEVWCSVVRIGDWGYVIHNNSTSDTIGASFLTIGIENIGTGDRYFSTFNKLDRIISNVVPSLSRVNQIVLMWDGATQSMYINGSLQGSKALASTSNRDATTSIVGTFRNLNGYRLVNGNIFNIKIYNKALTQQEILQNYNATKGRYNL